MRGRKTIYIIDRKLPEGQVSDGSYLKPYPTIQEALDSVTDHQRTDFISMTIDKKK